MHPRTIARQLSIALRYLRRATALAGMLTLGTLQVAGQPFPANIGFETGTFQQWNGATGTCCPVWLNAPGMLSGRQEITSGNASDPHAAGTLPVVAPGSLFSARLGNDLGDAQSEQLSYSFAVPADSLLLVIRFALVFENANHPASKQPRFAYRVTGSTGAPAGCHSEEIVCGFSSLPFSTNGNIESLGWTFRLMDLSGMVGDSLTIQFETGDCEPGGHFGYAYVDGELVAKQLNGVLCNPDGSATVYAPPGITGTWMNGVSADSLVLPDPAHAGTISFEPANGCGIFFEKDFTFLHAVTGITPVASCHQTLQFNAEPPGANFFGMLWNFGDGALSPEANPVHVFQEPGTYEVSLQIELGNHCRDTLTASILVQQDPEAGIKLPDACPGKPVAFENLTQPANQSATHCMWYVDGILQSTAWEPGLQFEAGTHVIQLAVSDNAGCADTATVQLDVQWTDACLGEFPGCYLPGAFTPNGDGINDVYTPVCATPDVRCEMEIVDRFGALRYTGGAWNGAGCPEGIYLCKLQLGTGTGSLSLVKTVCLIR